MTPIIGITTQGYKEKKTISSHYDHHYSVPKEYADSVLRAGGIPVLVPPNITDWPRLWDALDGLIVTGGTDVSPAHYGGNADNPRVHADDDERDAGELALVRHAVHAESAKPLLFVCRGIQVLNVALGGTLHPHLPDLLDSDIHRGDDGLWALHDCHVERGSHLADVMGAEVVNTYSGHHQALDKLGEGLRVVATAPDGIVEAVTSDAHPWLVAVQWHPEKTTATDPTQQRLFDALVAQATP